MDATFSRAALIFTSDYWSSADCRASIAHAWVIEQRIWHLFTPRRFSTADRRATITPITRPGRPGWWCWRLFIPDGGYLYLEQQNLHSQPCSLPPPGTVDREHRLHLYSATMPSSRDQNSGVYASWPMTVMRARG